MQQPNRQPLQPRVLRTQPRHHRVPRQPLPTERTQLPKTTQRPARTQSQTRTDQHRPTDSRHRQVQHRSAATPAGTQGQRTAPPAGNIQTKRLLHRVHAEQTLPTSTRTYQPIKELQTYARNWVEVLALQRYYLLRPLEQRGQAQQWVSVVWH